MERNTEVHGLTLTGPPLPAGCEGILTAEALQFVELLVREFGARREELLARRTERQAAFDRGEQPDFLVETAAIRCAPWQVAPVPAALQDRRVEITGPASDRKMVINALNSGARVFMADLEDANSPTWANTILSQRNLYDAARRTISYAKDSGKAYALQEQTAILFVRPRGWHMEEKHVLFEGKPISASLFDFGLYLFHNRTLAPYFYLPKLESHLEARLWNEVFVRAQQELGIPQGTIKATVLIETILAAFEMEEILYELQEHSAGLNCGRWDYIFSYLKKFRNQPDVILPDRAQVTMMSPFMRAYSLLTIQTCHKRGAHAIGGMAAQIPVKQDAAANAAAFAKVRSDKEREARDGHDGTWVAHPGLVPVALEVFDAHMPTANQLHRLREDVQVSATDLLEVPTGTITEDGVRTNIRVGVQYIAAWLQGSGAVPLYHLMEDAATAEISRAQLWQWIRHPQGVLDDGRSITAQWVEALIGEELLALQAEFGMADYERRGLGEAAQLFRDLVFQEQFEEFLTRPGYQRL